MPVGLTQWNCKEDGHPTDILKDIEYGYTKVLDSRIEISEQLERVRKEPRCWTLLLWLLTGR